MKFILINKFINLSQIAVNFISVGPVDLHPHILNMQTCLLKDKGRTLFGLN